MTKEGFYIETENNYVSKEEVTGVIKIVQNILIKKIPKIYLYERFMHVYDSYDYVIFFHYGDLEGPNKDVDGYINYVEKIIKLKIYEKQGYCIADTALVHELLHFFERYVGGSYDIYHSDAKIWEKDDKNSIEFLAKKETYTKFCVCN